MTLDPAHNAVERNYHAWESRGEHQSLLDGRATLQRKEDRDRRLDAAEKELGVGGATEPPGLAS